MALRDGRKKSSKSSRWHVRSRHVYVLSFTLSPVLTPDWKHIYTILNKSLKWNKKAGVMSAPIKIIATFWPRRNLILSNWLRLLDAVSPGVIIIFDWIPWQEHKSMSMCVSIDETHIGAWCNTLTSQQLRRFHLKSGIDFFFRTKWAWTQAKKKMPYLVIQGKKEKAISLNWHLTTRVKSFEMMTINRLCSRRLLIRVNEKRNKQLAIPPKNKQLLSQSLTNYRFSICMKFQSLHKRMLFCHKWLFYHDKDTLLGY